MRIGIAQVAPALTLVLGVCGFTTGAPAKQPSTVSDGATLNGATLNGTILDDSGRPTQDATVFVYSARLKTGYAIVCPTCWIDCGKRAETDEQGRFTITGLNPALKFRLLVVKEGFRATAKGGVDPAQGPLPPIKLAARGAPLDESKIVHGRVTDVAGSPVSGALIEPVGGTLPDGGRYFGVADWIDPLAVTNAAGEFAIVATKPFTQVMLKISPRALAPAILNEAPGPDAKSIVLTQGATVMGRLIATDGTPIASAEVVMMSHARGNGQDFNDQRVGTDTDGSFAFTNVPAHRIWGLYPAAESLQGRNLTAGPTWCETIADGQVIKLGRLTLRPGFTVSGKVDLIDKQEIPPGMHVSVWSEFLGDRLADIASDGSFEIKTLAPGIYSLNAGIAGYTPVADSPQELIVERDRRDVIIHMARSP